MKSSELKKLVEEYKALKSKSSRPNLPYDHKTQQKMDEIEHRYFHETGQPLKSVLDDY
jgi:hypothetical protein